MRLVWFVGSVRRMDEELISRLFEKAEPQRAMGEALLSDSLAEQLKEVDFDSLSTTHLLSLLIAVTINADSYIAALATEIRNLRSRLAAIENPGGDQTD